jgi:hypothetical protein
VDQRLLDRNDPNQRDDAEDEREIVDVRPDDVPDCDRPQIGQGRVSGYHQLRHGGAGGDDGEADREFRQPESTGQPDHGIDEESGRTKIQCRYSDSSCWMEWTMTVFLR